MISTNFSFWLGQDGARGWPDLIAIAHSTNYVHDQRSTVRGSSRSCCCVSEKRRGSFFGGLFATSEPSPSWKLLLCRVFKKGNEKLGNGKENKAHAKDKEENGPAIRLTLMDPLAAIRLASSVTFSTGNFRCFCCHSLVRNYTPVQGAANTTPFKDKSVRPPMAFESITTKAAKLRVS